MRPRCSKVYWALVAAAMAAPAVALDYRSVEPAAAVLFDAPSVKGKKLFIVRKHTPLEVVVSLDSWVKVRDAEGALAWIERKALSERRTLAVSVARADVRQAPDPASALVFEAERNVALEVLDAAKDGWVKVRHVDGQSGYVRVTQVWGL